VQVELKQLREMYTKDIAGIHDTFNAILLGALGTGKTTILRTCRFPALVHSFDPGGCKVKLLENHIADGRIVVDNRYEKDSLRDPTYPAWEKEFLRLKAGGVFEGIGTYFIDSFTTWITSMVYTISKLNGKQHGLMSQPDWQVAKNTVIDNIKLCTALPCDFIMSLAI